MSRKNRNKRKAGRPGQPVGPVSARPVAAASSPGLHQAASQPAAAARQQTAVQPGVGAPRPLRRDQQRGLCAYAWAEAAKRSGALENYEIAVQSFAAALLRSGFAAAVSVLERSADRSEFRLLIENLASYPLPGIAAATAADWPARVRALPDTRLYMQATRELIALFAWLRRACRALGREQAG
jgi:hypothetical protein